MRHPYSKWIVILCLKQIKIRLNGFHSSYSFLCVKLYLVLSRVCTASLWAYRSNLVLLMLYLLLYWWLSIFLFPESIVLPHAPLFAGTEGGEDLLWHFISPFSGSKEGMLTSCQFFCMKINLWLFVRLLSIRIMKAVVLTLSGRWGDTAVEKCLASQGSSD